MTYREAAFFPRVDIFRRYFRAFKLHSEAARQPVDNQDWWNEGDGVRRLNPGRRFFGCFGGCRLEGIIVTANRHAKAGIFLYQHGRLFLTQLEVHTLPVLYYETFSASSTSPHTRNCLK